jgi:hypothetical protein
MSRIHPVNGRQAAGTTHPVGACTADVDKISRPVARYG